MKYAIMIIDRAPSILSETWYIRSKSKGASLDTTEDIQEAYMFSDPEDFESCVNLLANAWIASKVRIFEPHAAQYHLTDLIRI